MKKAKRKLKAKVKEAKKQKKLQVVREFLEEINYHCEQVSITLRHLANALDNVRSYHLAGKDEEGEAAMRAWKNKEKPS